MIGMWSRLACLLVRIVSARYSFRDQVEKKERRFAGMLRPVRGQVQK